MGVEIERKFLVCGEGWRHNVGRSRAIEQGYLSVNPDRTIRVRIADGQAWLTIKGRAKGLVRAEFEYEIPADDAEAILAQFCAGHSLEKRRYEVREGDDLWEVDEFFGANRGLVVAEIELERSDQEFSRPSWLGQEVTGQARYYNARLVEVPYAQWSDGKASGDDEDIL